MIERMRTETTTLRAEWRLAPFLDPDAWAMSTTCSLCVLLPYHAEAMCLSAQVELTSPRAETPIENDAGVRSLGLQEIVLPFPAPSACLRITCDIVEPHRQLTCADSSTADGVIEFESIFYFIEKTEWKSGRRCHITLAQVVSILVVLFVLERIVLHLVSSIWKERRIRKKFSEQTDSDWLLGNRVIETFNDAGEKQFLEVECTPTPETPGILIRDIIFDQTTQIDARMLRRLDLTELAL